MASRKLQVEIVGDASSLEKAFKNASRAGSRMSGTLRTLGKAAAIGLGAAFAGAAVTIKRGFDEIAESQKVAAQTAAVLKSTGNAAKVTAKDVEDLAGSLSRMSGVDDEAIQSGQNLLLTFTSIRNEVGKGNDVFNQATEAALDMSVAMGTDMRQSSLLLGKALNQMDVTAEGNVRGFSALRRVGVQISPEMNKMAAAFIEAGKPMEAQKILLRELQTEFGGSAKAFGDTLPGELAKARNAFDEMAGQIAAKLLPALTEVLTWVNAHWPQISATFEAVASVIGRVFGFLQTATTTLIGVWNQHKETITAIWVAVQAAIQRFVTWFQTNLLPAIQTVIAAVRAIWERFGGDITRITQTAFTAVLNVIRPIMNTIKSVIELVLALIRGDWSAAWNALKAIVSNALTAAVAVVRGSVTLFLTAAKAIGVAIKDGVLDGIGAVANWLGAKLREIPAAVAATAGEAGAAAVRIGQAVIAGVLNGLSGLWNAVKSKVESTLRGVLDSISPFSPVEHGGEVYIGAPIVAGAVEGITKNAPQLPAALVATIKRIVALAPAFFDAGLALGESLAVGLLDARGKVVDAANELSAAIARSLNVAVELPRVAAGNAEARRDQLIGRIPGLATGGVVMRPTLAVIGEAGPEAVIPLNRMGGGGAVINISFPNYVGSRDELIEEVRRGLFDVARRNPGALPGVA